MSEFNFDRDVSFAHLEGAGWNMGMHSHSNPFDCHMLYVRDYRTDHVELFTVSRSDFDRIRLDVGAGELSPLVVELVARRQQGTLSDEEERSFLPAMVGYIKATSTFRQWRSLASAQERLHAVLCIYPENGCMLRPFILRESGTVVSSDNVVRLTDQVRATDLQRHPEWHR